MKKPEYRKRKVGYFKPGEPGYEKGMATDAEMRNWSNEIKEFIVEYNKGNKSLTQIAAEVFGDEDGTNRTSLAGRICRRLIKDGVIEAKPKNIEEELGKEIVQYFYNAREKNQKNIQTLVEEITKKFKYKKVTKEKLKTLDRRLMMNGVFENRKAKRYEKKFIGEVLAQVSEHGMRQAARILAKKYPDITVGKVARIVRSYRDNKK